MVMLMKGFGSGGGIVQMLHLEKVMTPTSGNRVSEYMRPQLPQSNRVCTVTYLRAFILDALVV
jgi:hypothetical protein